MRIPFSKVYRAFPELDQFTDAQCEGYVRDAEVQHAGLVGSGVAAAVLVIMLGLPVVGAIGAGLERPVERWLGARNADAVPLVVGLLILVLGCLLGCGGMTLRDMGLRAAIRKRLEGARCGVCGYSLLGLAVRGGWVLCPECGHEEHLGGRGLSASDIMGREERGEGAARAG